MYLHATTSIFILLLYGFYFLVNYKKINKAVIGSLVLFLLGSSYILIKSFSSASTNYLPIDKWIYFLSLRVSGHFFPSTWSILSYVLFGILILLFLISFKYKPKEEKHNKVILLSIGTLILCIISFFFTEILPVKQIVQASFLRGIVIFRVIAIIYVINYIIQSLKSSSRIHKQISLGISVFLLLLIIIPFFVGGHRGIFDEVNLEKPIGPWEDVALNSKDLTSKDSLFITPPFSLGFTFFSERSEFINWKTSGVGVYSSRYVAEAFSRFAFVCKHDFELESRTELVEECTKGYENINEEDLKKTKDQYKITHIIVRKPKTLDFNLIYENEEYRIYEL